MGLGLGCCDCGDDEEQPCVFCGFDGYEYADDPSAWKFEVTLSGFAGTNAGCCGTGSAIGPTLLNGTHEVVFTSSGIGDPDISCFRASYQSGPTQDGDAFGIYNVSVSINFGHSNSGCTLDWSVTPYVIVRADWQCTDIAPPPTGLYATNLSYYCAVDESAYTLCFSQNLRPNADCGPWTLGSLDSVVRLAA